MWFLRLRRYFQLEKQCCKARTLFPPRARLPCISLQRISYIFLGFQSGSGQCLHLALLFLSGKTAIRNVDLDCYEDINEIQFASLLYDKFCMVTLLFLSPFFLHHNMIYVSPLQACGRGGCKTYSMIRLRLCPICETEK